MAYAPCRNGIHICGIDDARDEFVTVANHPGVSRSLFDKLRNEFAIDDDPDVVVDLMVDGDIVDDFRARRQSLAAIAAMSATQ